MRARRRDLTMLMTLAGLAASGALAQDAQPPQAGSADVQAISPLQGPKVEDDRAPGTDSRFSMGMQRARESERPIPLRIYERELRTLEGAEVEESLRLSIEQRQAIRKIIQEHRRSLRAFYAEHREEIAAIRAMNAPDPGANANSSGQGAGALQTTGNQGSTAPRAAAARRQAGEGRAATNASDAQRTGPAGVRGGAGGLSPEARARMQALRAKGPQESAAITRIWEALNEDQRNHLESRFEAFRAEAMRKFEARKKKPEAGDAGASATNAPNRAARRRAATPRREDD